MNEPVSITAELVPDEGRRIKFFPHRFERRMMKAERLIYSIASEQTQGAYNGGYWDFYDLSNGGCYMGLKSDKTFKLTVPGNGFSEEVSALVLSIVSCLVAFGRLAWEYQNEPAWSDYYHALRNYVSCLPDETTRRQIWEAID